MDLVEPGLYIGGRESVLEFISDKRGATLRILTLDVEPLALGTHSPNLLVKFVKCSDEPNTDLLSAFDDCVDFIADGVDGAVGCEAVLVHCLAGVSRSAAVMLAYLMKRRKLSLHEAQQELKKAHPKADPNPGFMKQLELYEAMGNTVDKTSAAYKQYRLELLANQIQDQGFASEGLLSSLIREFTTQGAASGKQFKCRKCRKTLFDSGNLMEHNVGQGPSSFKWHKQETSTSATEDCCTSYFIELVDWMLPTLEGTTSGKISCPKCQGRLGSFHWAGLQCSCGAWVTPAFQFHQNRVDKTFTHGSCR